MITRIQSWHAVCLLLNQRILLIIETRSIYPRFGEKSLDSTDNSFEQEFEIDQEISNWLHKMFSEYKTRLVVTRISKIQP